MAREIEVIAALLSDPSAEKRHAAAVVLGELKAKSPAVLKGLAGLLTSGTPVLERAAAEALAKIGASPALNELFALLSSRDVGVRSAAERAILSCGSDIVAPIKKRYESAGVDERRALDTILAALGGKDAYSTLLDGLLSSDPQDAHQAALKARAHLKDAGGNERRSVRAQVEKFLKRDEVQAAPHSLAAALKILGYLEDEKTLPTLLSYAVDETQPTAVRQEAVLGLRFGLTQKAEIDAVISGLIDVAGTYDRGLARTALDTLGMLTMPDKHIEKFANLATHDDPVRAGFVITALGTFESDKASRALVDTLQKTNLRRAELCATALEPRKDAVPELVKALLTTDNSELAKLMARILKLHTAELKPAMKKKLIDGCVQRLKDGDSGWDAILQVAREADPQKTADALRELAAKLKKSKKNDKAVSVLTLLEKTEGSTHEDRFRLAAMKLAQSKQDTSPGARNRDPALKHMQALADEGFDVVSAMKKERSLELKELFYVGFHFADIGHALGEELLEEVVSKGGRTKLAKIAKNKLKLIET